MNGLINDINRDHYRKPQPIGRLSCGAWLQGINLYNTPALKAQETGKMGWEDSKCQGSRGFAMKLCLLVKADTTPTKSH